MLFDASTDLAVLIVPRLATGLRSVPLQSSRWGLFSHLRVLIWSVSISSWKLFHASRWDLPFSALGFWALTAVHSHFLLPPNHLLWQSRPMMNLLFRCQSLDPTASVSLSSDFQLVLNVMKGDENCMGHILQSQSWRVCLCWWWKRWRQLWS